MIWIDGWIDGFATNQFGTQADLLRRHPTFGLWPVALRDDLRAALQGGLRKVVMWTQTHEGREALFPHEDAFFNINTPQDLARAQEML